MLSKYLCAGIALGALATATSAQSVFEATSVTLQAQIGRSETGFDSCGVRGIVVTPDENFLEAYDFSISVRPDMFYGMLKGGKRRVPVSTTYQADKLPPAIIPSPVKFWIARELRGRPLLGHTVSPSSDAGFSLMLGDIVESYKIINEIITGERMQFALRYANEKSDLVVSFSGKLTPEQTSAVQACMVDVLDQLKASNE